MSRFKLYRSESNSGTKDWAILAQSDQVQIRHGRNGTKLKLTEVPLSKCKGSSPQLEMKDRIQRKLDDASSDYVYVDEVIIDGDGKLSTFTNPKLKELIYWNLSIDVNDSSEVLSILKSTAEDIKRDFPEQSVIIGDELIRVNGYQLNLKPSGNNSVDFESGNGSGFFGIEMGVYPALWIIYLSNRLSGQLTVSSDGQQNIASSYLEPVGYFLEDDVARFNEFASKHNFLSVENKILSRFTSLSECNDWL